MLGTLNALAQSQTASTPSATDTPSRFRSPDDGWFDVSAFLDERYGFLPIVLPITEPAVGYGAAGGVTFISQPLGAAEAGRGRPNVTALGGMGTENGTWGAFVGDMRHWMDDRLQTLGGLVYASVNLDFHGIGDDSVLANDPLRYNLEPKGGLIQAKYRLGDSRFWAGASYAYSATDVSFGTPPGTPGIPAYDERSTVAGLTPSFTYDARDNIFTPTRGTFVELTGGFFSKAFGGDDEFQRVRLISMQLIPLNPDWYLGLRGEAAASFGDAPFYMRPFIYLRGVPVMRYQGEETAQIEAEVRWQFWKRFSLVGFAGGGVAWNDFERFDDSRSVTTGGGGFRYEIARKYGIHAGADVAFSKDNAAVYVQVGSAWARP